MNRLRLAALLILPFSAFAADPALLQMVMPDSQVVAGLQAGLRTIRLLTNHPRKIVGLDAYGIQITEQVPV
jgi:hypothetical protein